MKKEFVRKLEKKTFKRGVNFFHKEISEVKPRYQDELGGLIVQDGFIGLALFKVYNNSLDLVDFCIDSFDFRHIIPEDKEKLKYTIQDEIARFRNLNEFMVSDENYKEYLAFWCRYDPKTSKLEFIKEQFFRAKPIKKKTKVQVYYMRFLCGLRNLLNKRLNNV